MFWSKALNICWSGMQGWKGFGDRDLLWVDWWLPLHEGDIVEVEKIATFFESILVNKDDENSFNSSK